MRSLPFGICAAIVLLGCTPATRQVLVPWPAGLARERVETEHEWRDAWAVPAGDGRTFDLGALPKDPVLRVGVLDGGKGRARRHIQVKVGAAVVAEIRTVGPETWVDKCVDLSEYASPGEHCYIVFDRRRSFWVGPCELVSREPSTASVVIFLIDALRLDHLGCYGYSRDTSPEIDAFARDAIIFTQLMPPSSWTRPSVGSLLTGTYPAVHGSEDRPNIMRQDLPTLAKALAGAGYETHGFMNNPICLPRWGFGNEFFRFVEFFHYADADSVEWETADDAEVIDAAIATLRTMAGRPCFLFLHTMAPHAPYTPPSPYDARFFPEQGGGPAPSLVDVVISQYDGEIAYIDAQFGRFMRELKKLGLYDDSLIILLSDHGEEFLEHGGKLHGRTLYEEVLRVPLLIKMPGGAYAGQSRDGLVEMVDMAPTILDILGAPLEDRFQGKSFMGLIETGRAEKRLGYASLLLDSHSLRAAKTTEMKYIRNMVAPRERWYDLRRDAEEQHPLDEPMPGGEVLAYHTAQIATRGAHGLHLLFTTGPSSSHVITGTLKGKGLDTLDMRYPSRATELTKRGDAVEFRIEMRPLRPGDVPRPHEIAGLEQDHARLYVEVDGDAALAVNLQVDGHPIPEECVFAGKDGHPMALSGTIITPRDLIADPEGFDPTVLPKRFALYVWYVPSVGTVADEDLDPRLIAAFRALGYLD